jgi:16S rRNA (cytosine(1402)-N(4))-methyltransferase
VPAADVLQVAQEAEATPYDIPGVEMGHVGERCSFDAFLAKYHLDDPALQKLATIIRGVLPPDRSGIDPATRSFQALRIRVNDELGEIERALDQAGRLLTPTGRLIVVSFHSLEDRIVKRFMVDAAGRAPSPSRHDPRGLAARPAPRFRLLTARPLRPSADETNANPRARSARLRAMECTLTRSAT